MPPFRPQTSSEQTEDNISERIGGPPIPESSQIDPNAPSNIKSAILIYDHNERIQFADEFRAPDIDISHERDTVDHEVISGAVRGEEEDDRPEFMVQALGTRPPEIDLTGWLTQDQLRVADNMVSANIVGLITARYVGLAVPEMVDIPYSRTYHDEHGWIFEVSMDFLGVRWDGLPLSDSSDGELIPDEAEDIFGQV